MGNKNAKNVAKTELNDEEIETLLANTHYNRFEIIDWFEGFIVILSIFLYLYPDNSLKFF